MILYVRGRDRESRKYEDLELTSPELAGVLRIAVA